ncbi:MAG: Ig-like domain-containing protein [Spirosomataceae bacterium]
MNLNLIRISRWMVLAVVALMSASAMAQTSSNTVSFRLTYDPATLRYTVFVVPNYSVPNANNTGSTERGATAQVTLAVPAAFQITGITDVRGVWEKNPIKLGPGQPNQNWSSSNLPSSTNYYVIGKSPEETDYGTFTSGTPVALFTFQGVSCQGVIRLIEPNDPFIAAADQLFALNTANSFYSRSGQPASGNQNPLEQFIAVSGSPANCSTVSTVVANPDNQSVSRTTPSVIPILANDTKNGAPIPTNEAVITLLSNPVGGGIVINSTGTLTYTPNGTFSGVDCFQYRVCLQLEPNVCSSAQVCLTVPQAASTDVAISKTVSSTTAAVNGEVTFTITAQNTGNTAATNVRIEDQLPAGLTLISATPSQGTWTAPTWSIPTLGAGQTATLTLRVRVGVDGVTTNVARLVTLDQTDTNQGNNSSQACLTVPILLCQGDRLDLSVDNSLTNVLWFRDNVQIGTGNTISVTSAGSYTTQATNQTCPASGCCPIVVQTEICCPVDICIPVNVRKVKRNGRT